MFDKVTACIIGKFIFLAANYAPLVHSAIRIQITLQSSVNILLCKGPLYSGHIHPTTLQEITQSQTETSAVAYCSLSRLACRQILI